MPPTLSTRGGPFLALGVSSSRSPLRPVPLTRTSSTTTGRSGMTKPNSLMYLYPPIQGSNQNKATRPAGQMLDSQKGTYTSQQRLLQSRQHGVSGLWPGAAGQTPLEHNQCLGNEDAGSPQC